MIVRIFHMEGQKISEVCNLNTMITTLYNNQIVMSNMKNNQVTTNMI